ncbi:DUF58 domain-containing protein [Jeotgalibacillus soli]|uniref:DUF58 domain-containing protein n=1 Tax=Jeotgalibacillus soli TaxID=889306 RepID=A0A0C2RKC7_9BACL|nr:DUF58 domain-containing protein [Jeotgalibacillus soli]KIL50650.1 hypothetical protein KP78_06510 [Jeotgalibacillus soli]
MKKIWSWFQEISKVLLLMLLLAGTFAYAMFQGGFVSWFLFYSFFPFGLYSVLIMIYPLKDFTVERSIKSQELKAGSSVTIAIRLKRRILMPLFYLIVEDQVTSSIFNNSQSSQVKKLIYPGFRKTIELDYQINDLPRGEHKFSGIELKTGDFLGLFQKTRSLEEESSILVYPSYTIMPYHPINVRFDQGVASTELKIQRDTTMATGLREYQPGDRVSWIHWKSFARTNDLMTKEFEERKSHDVCVILDRTPSSSFEEMVTFTASLAKAILKKGAQIGFISSGQTRNYLPIRSGDSHERQIFYQLAKVQPDSTLLLEQVLKTETGYVQQSAAMMLVTSRLSREMVHQLHDFTKNNSTVAIFIVKSKQSRVSAEEQQIKALALSKGIWVKECYTGHFADVFSEVKQA